MAPPSLTNGRRKSEGYIRAKILSAYDLPMREAPSFVSLTIGHDTVTTGPPSQRHKDRNSFKFGRNDDGGNGNVLEICQPLAVLYGSTARIQVNFPQNPNHTLTADYKLSQLKIHETTWLILNLEPDESIAPPDNDTFSVVAPTLRLQLMLSGPYRTEIAALVNAIQAWFAFVDGLEQKCGAIVQKLPKMPDPKWFLVPATPVLALTVVSLPVLLGIGIVALPMLLPVVAVGAIVLVVLLGVGTIAYSSTSAGRLAIGGVISPALNHFVSTPAGQGLVYQTGPRPTPVSAARIVLPSNMWGKLIVSLLIDLIGSSSYLLPIVGEAFDIGWAPIQTIFIMAMYDHITPNLKYVSFVEEIMPFTDIIPSASIGWLAEFGVPFVLGGVNKAPQPMSGDTAVLRTPLKSNRSNPL